MFVCTEKTLSKCRYNLTSVLAGMTNNYNKYLSYNNSYIQASKKETGGALFLSGKEQKIETFLIR